MTVNKSKVTGCPNDCTYDKDNDEMKNPQPKERIFKTTRTGEPGSDEYRDFSGWNVEEELARLRLAIKEWTPEAIDFARIAIKNLDENFVRWGLMPRSWNNARHANPELHIKSHYWKNLPQWAEDVKDRKSPDFSTMKKRLQEKEKVTMIDYLVSTGNHTIENLKVLKFIDIYWLWAYHKGIDTTELKKKFGEHHKMEEI